MVSHFSLCSHFGSAAAEQKADFERFLRRRANSQGNAFSAAPSRDGSPKLLYFDFSLIPEKVRTCGEGRENTKNAQCYTFKMSLDAREPSPAKGVNFVNRICRIFFNAATFFPTSKRSPLNHASSYKGLLFLLLQDPKAFQGDSSEHLAPPKEVRQRLLSMGDEPMSLPIQLGHDCREVADAAKTPNQEPEHTLEVNEEEK